MVLLYSFVWQNIYDHAGGLRKNDFPAGPDTYREFVYRRDEENADFVIVNDPTKEVTKVE